MAIEMKCVSVRCFGVVSERVRAPESFNFLRVWIFAACLCLLSAGGVQARDIVMLSGQVYHGVTVTRVDPTGIAISHKDGAAFLDFLLLPTDIRKEFGYSAEDYKAGKSADAKLKAQKEVAIEKERRLTAEENRLAAEAAAKQARE